MKILSLLLLGCLSLGATFPNVKVGDSAAINSKAVFEAKSTTLGMLPPRMTTTQKNAISSPPDGLIVYDTTLESLCEYNVTRSAWETLPSGAALGASQVVTTDSNSMVQSVAALGATLGGTGATSAAAGFNALSPMTTLGDLIYGGASGAGTRVAGNTTATKKFLNQTGDGSNSAAPAWSALIAADIPSLAASIITSGQLLPARGGTGQDFSASTGAVSVAAGTFSVGTLALTNGGSGQTTKAAAFDAFQPMTTSGDIIYGGASGTGTRLAKGSDGQVLTLASGIPSWAATGTSPTSVYFSGHFGTTATWDLTTNSFGDGTNANGNTLTTVYSNGITVTAAASNKCGITFTPSASTSVYLITANITYNTQAGGDNSFQLTDGTTVFSISDNIGGGHTSMTAVYAPGTGSAVTVKIQLYSAVNGNHVFIENLHNAYPVEWMMVQIK